MISVWPENRWGKTTATLLGCRPVIWKQMTAAIAASGTDKNIFSRMRNFNLDTPSCTL
jgi:hypothetical protein